MYCIQHCFICRPSDSTVSEDAGIEPRTVATSALAVRLSNHLARSHPHLARSHPLNISFTSLIFLLGHWITRLEGGGGGYRKVPKWCPYFLKGAEMVRWGRRSCFPVWWRQASQAALNVDLGEAQAHLSLHLCTHSMNCTYTVYVYTADSTELWYFDNNRRNFRSENYTRFYCSISIVSLEIRCSFVEPFIMCENVCDYIWISWTKYQEHIQHIQYIQCKNYGSFLPILVTFCLRWCPKQPFCYRHKYKRFVTHYRKSFQ